jgi:predicted enzyme related to lactoylglutathione lyase
MTVYDRRMLKNTPVVPYIPATDIARARKFYEEKVGLVPKQEIAGGVVYECGKGSWIFLYQSAGAGTSKASQAFWQVEDVEAEVTALRAKGVVFEEYDLPGLQTVNGIASGGGTRAAWFKDTEGNIMALIQSMK